MPVRLWIEASARCNFSCVMCPNKDLAESAKGDMEWDIFRRVIDEARGFVFDLNLHHRGESLLHPQIVPMIRYASSKGMVTKLHTNGSLLKGETIDGIIAAGLHRLSISFDGFAKEDYEKIRRGADFDEVVAHIQELLRRRRSLGKRLPFVAIEVIELSAKQVEAEKRKRFIAAFAGTGLDELVIKKPHNWAGYLKTAYEKKHYAPCTFLWNALLVLWNGDVSPCSQDFFATIVLGNVRDQSLRDIWNGGPLTQLRRAHLEKRIGEYSACAACDRPWRDTLFGLPREYLKNLVFKRMP